MLRLLCRCNASRNKRRDHYKTPQNRDHNTEPPSKPHLYSAVILAFRRTAASVLGLKAVLWTFTHLDATIPHRLTPTLLP